MPTQVLKSSDRFPVGTSVGLYLRTQRNLMGGPPLAAAITSVAVAADGTLTYTGLFDDTSYTAYALVNGEHRYVDFDTHPSLIHRLETIAKAEAVTNIASPASGTLVLAGGLVLPGGENAGNPTYSKIGILSGNVAGATLTNQWFALVRRSDRTIIAVTADDLANGWAASTIKELSLVNPYTPKDNEAVLIARLVAGTTPPNMLGQTLLASAVKEGGTANTGLTTPLAEGTQLGTVTPTTSRPYAYVR